MAKKISEVFPDVFNNALKDGYGFKKDTEVFADAGHLKVIGNLCDFTLPQNYVEIVIVEADKATVKYGLRSATIPKKQNIDKEIQSSLANLLKQQSFATNDFRDLHAKLNDLRNYESLLKDTIPIARKEDNLIRTIITAPKTYSSNSVEKWPWPITYVGQKRVIICAPHILEPCPPAT